MVIEATLETSIVPPQSTLPPTILIPQLFPSNILVQESKEATPGSKPLIGSYWDAFSQDWKDIQKAFESAMRELELVQNIDFQDQRHRC